MSALLAFIVGLFVGAPIGIFIMCLLVGAHECEDVYRAR